MNETLHNDNFQLELSLNKLLSLFKFNPYLKSFISDFYTVTNSKLNYEQKRYVLINLIKTGTPEVGYEIYKPLCSDKM